MGPAYSYTTRITWTGGREGRLQADSLPELTFSAPEEFHGRAGMWTPEHFYVAAANACLLTTFLAIAEISKLEIIAYEAVGTGKLEKGVAGDEKGYQITEIVLRPRITVVSEADRDRAWRLIEKAEKNCLVSRSMKTRMTLEPEILVK